MHLVYHSKLSPCQLHLWFEDLNNVAFHIANRTSLEVRTARETADLMSTRSNDRINGIIIAENTLQ